MNLNQVLTEVTDRLDELEGTEAAGGQTDPEAGRLQVRDHHKGARAPVAGLALTPEQSLKSWAQGRRPELFGEPGEPEPSFDRLMRGLVSGDWSGAELEQKLLGESPLTAGGYMIPTPVATDVIDRARNAARIFQAGARTVPMASQTLVYPRLEAEATPGWRSEGAALADQAMTFGPVTFTARSLAMLVKINVELFDDAPQSDDVIRESFAAQMALELDRAALRGSGTAPEPRGVRNQTGVTLSAHGANGAAIGPLGTGLGYDFLADALGAVRQANFEPTAQLVAPRTETSLQKLKASDNAYAQPPAGLPARLATNQVPVNLTVGTSNDCSEVYTGQWDQLLVGMRTELSIRFLQERFIDQLQYAFLAHLRADVQLGQPAAFVVDTGVRG